VPLPADRSAPPISPHSPRSLTISLSPWQAGTAYQRLPRARDWASDAIAAGRHHRSPRHYSLACPVGTLRLCPLAPAEPSRHPLTELSRHRHCAPHPRHGELAGTRHLSPPSLPRAPIKGPPKLPNSSPRPRPSLLPSQSSIEPAPPRPSSAPVSLTLLPLLSSSPIKVVLELHHFTASTTHLFPSPITPVVLAGDLTAASAHHLVVDQPSRAFNDQISLTTVIPYLRLYLATIPSTQNRTTGEEPPSGSPAIGSYRRGPPPDAFTPLSLARGPTPTAPARAVPLLREPAGPPAHARAPALAGPKSPPRPS
jgi:hypothetical protein